MEMHVVVSDSEGYPEGCESPGLSYDCGNGRLHMSFHFNCHKEYGTCDISAANDISWRQPLEC